MKINYIFGQSVFNLSKNEAKNARMFRCKEYMHVLSSFMFSTDERKIYFFKLKVPPVYRKQNDIDLIYIHSQMGV